VNASGTLEIDTNETAGSLAGAGNVTLNANLTLGEDATTAVSGDMSGAGLLTKGGTGTLTLSGDNSSFSGGVSITTANGVLSLDSANAAGTGDLTFSHQGKLYNGASGPGCD
jgi:autotransporter-associated beta strand protein